MSFKFRFNLNIAWESNYLGLIENKSQGWKRPMFLKEQFLGV